VLLTRVKCLTRHDTGVLVVRDHAARLLGTLTKRDMMHGLARFSAAAFAHTARSLMTRNVQVCASDDGASSVMLKSTQRHIRHMPVVQDSRLVGLVSPGDLVKQRLSKLGNRLGGGGGTSIATAVGGSFSRHLGARSGPRICSAQAGTFATAQERRPKEKRAAGEHRAAQV